MPVQACQEDGRPGWRWGEQGKCYTYAPGNDAASGQAKRKAYLQGAAIGKGESFSKGDFPGHDFRGNQWTGGIAGWRELRNGDRVKLKAEDALTLAHAVAGGKPIDFHNLQVKGKGNENLFQHSVREIPREQMPRLAAKAKQLRDFMDYLKAQGVDAKVKEMDPRDLVATQNQLDGAKVGENLQKLENSDGEDDKKAVLVSQDNAILDGHHRWAAHAFYALDHPDHQIRVVKVNENIDPLIQQALAYSAAHGLQGQAFGTKAEEPEPPNPDQPWLYIDGEWWHIATDDEDGVPDKLEFPKGGQMPKPYAPDEEVTKQEPDAGDVHVPGLEWDGKERRKRQRRDGQRIMVSEQPAAPEVPVMTVKGDVAGHDFHGNQYTEGGVGGSEPKLTHSEHADAAIGQVRSDRGHLPARMQRRHFEVIASHIRDNVPTHMREGVARIAADRLQNSNQLFDRNRFVRASIGEGSMTPRRLGKDENFFWIEKSEEPEQIVRGIVLVPDLIDSQGEFVGVDEIEKAAHQWMLDWQQQGVQHYGDHVPEIRPVESYLAPADFVIKGVDGEDHTVPKGTWVMASKVGSQRAWDMVLNRQLSGYSIQGSAIKHEVSL